MLDSHAHVGFSQFDEDRDEVVTRAREAGVQWIEVGTDAEQSKLAIETARRYREDGCLGASVGVHPSDVAGLSENACEELLELYDEENVVAVGEVGLDFYRGGTLEQQLPMLEQFVGLALERSLPVIFHVRSAEEQDAHEALLRFLSGLKQVPRGVVHTYSGTVAQAERYLDLGLHLSLSGVVTFKNAKDMQEVATTTPLDRILIETDCPFLAPGPYRGQRNEPAYVEYVAEKIAELRRVAVEEVQEQTTKNTRRLFRLAS